MSEFVYDIAVFEKNDLLVVPSQHQFECLNVIPHTELNLGDKSLASRQFACLNSHKCLGFTDLTFCSEYSVSTKSTSIDHRTYVKKSLEKRYDNMLPFYNKRGYCDRHEVLETKSGDLDANLDFCSKNPQCTTVLQLVHDAAHRSSLVNNVSFSCNVKNVKSRYVNFYGWVTWEKID